MHTILAVDSSGHLLAATDNDGFYQTTILIAAPEDPSITRPSEYTLDQNYPNPFSPSTTIRYGLPHKSAVQLAVFNTLGQQIKTLVQGKKRGRLP